MTFLATAACGFAALLAACAADDGGGGVDSPSTNTGGGNGTGGGSLGTGSTGSTQSPDIIERVDLDGFLYTDPSGDPAYKDPTLAAADLTAIQTAAETLPAVDDEYGFVYPFPDTMVPGNLAPLEMQWTAPAQNTLFMLTATPPDGKRHRFYFSCALQNTYCLWDMPAAELEELARTYGGQQVTLQYLAVSPGGAPAILSPTYLMDLSPEPVIGALYYWAAAPRIIKRVTFGAKAAADFIVPKSDTNAYDCAACHSVSRDGSTIAFAVSPEDGENIAGIQIAPTADPTTPTIAPPEGPTPFAGASQDLTHGNTTGPTTNLGINVALSPDGSLAAISGATPNDPNGWPIYLAIRNTNTADSIVDVKNYGDPVFGGDTKVGIQPEWSPDGTQLVVTLADNNPSVWASSARNSGIAIMPVTGGVLGTAKMIVANPGAGNGYHYYPTWSPDGKYVAFVTSWDDNDGKGSNGNRYGVLRMVEVAKAASAPITCPGPDCIELTRGTGYTPADAQAQSANTFAAAWPKFAPFAQGADKNIFFITFTAKRPRGAVPTSTTQLWMFGIDTKLIASGDPSYSPFWLPYQDESDGSLSPYWTETSPCNTEGGTCDGCLDSEVCVVDTKFNSCSCQVRDTIK
jgi:hypothetical protein